MNSRLLRKFVLVFLREYVKKTMKSPFQASGELRSTYIIPSLFPSIQPNRISVPAYIDIKSIRI